MSINITLSKSTSRYYKEYIELKTKLINHQSDDQKKEMMDRLTTKLFDLGVTAAMAEIDRQNKITRKLIVGGFTAGAVIGLVATGLYILNKEKQEKENESNA